jgi:CHAD domain-containing protein
MPRRTAPTGDAAELVRVLEARLDETLRQVGAVVDQPDPEPEVLHQLHRELRRLRVGLEVWIRASSNRQGTDLRALDRRVKRLARLVGGVRDRDVAIELLENGPKTLPSRERTSLRRLRGRIADDAHIGRELLRASLRTERDLGLFEGIRAGLHTRPSARRARAIRNYLESIRVEGQEAVRTAHKKARRKPSSRRLHRLRIRVRNWNHLSDLAASVDPTFPVPERHPLRSLQARLGRLHDLDVVEDLTAKAASPTWSKAIRKERRRQHGTLVRQLKSSRWRQIAPTADPRT